MQNDAQALPTVNRKPETVSKPNTHSKSSTVADGWVFSELKKAGASDEAALGWIAMRAARKAPIGEKALRVVIEQIRLSGISISEALELGTRKGWVGFMAEWVKDGAQASGHVRKPREWFQSEKGTKRKGEALGIEAFPGESMEGYRARIFKRIGEGAASEAAASG